MIVSRAEWGARPPRSVTRLDNPAGVTWHYVGPRMGAFPHSSCATKVRGIQAFHMDSRGWSDVAYNMLACPHGYAFVGRGRDVRSAANGTSAGNSGSHAVCALLGDGDTVTDGLLRALREARDYLMAAGTGSRTWVHGFWKATACPGSPLVAWNRAGIPLPGSPPPTPPKPPEEDEMLCFVRTDIDQPTWLSNGLQRRWVQDGDHLQRLARQHGISPAPVIVHPDDLRFTPIVPGSDLPPS